ncbi:MAG: lasso peptide isopeptide bond-forming cyclase [Cyanobacteria bacterium J06621_12]
MSAIAGIHYGDAQAVKREHIAAMVDLLAHRGSDAQGIWLDGAIALGNRLLWTTHESLLEQLPHVSESGLVITADARIDNRTELISQLSLNLPESQITDSQLILSAYEHWGESCVEHLVGDFAFGIWDASRQQLFCARDHFGVKPFYYYHSGSTLIFASEIKALFCLPTVPRQLNEIRVGEFLTSEFYDKTATIYQQIFRLPPAHTLTITVGEFKLQSYWQLDPTSELKLNSDAEYAAQFRAIFLEAVGCRLRSAYPVGSMLSGGLDSSSITCAARHLLAAAEQQQPDLHTFSAVFEQVPESDESFYINSVLKGEKLKPHYVHGDRFSPLIDLEQIIWYQDEPQFAANLYLNWQAYHLAQEQGVRVILDGFDGDSAVSHGFGYMRELARAGKWRSLIPELRGYSRNFNTPFLTLFWIYFHEYALQPTMTKNKLTRYIYWRWRGVADKIKLKLARNKPRLSSLSLVNPDLLERSNFSEHRQKLAAQSFISTSNEREEHFNAINVGSIPTTLELLDRTAAPCAVELRYPFWDKRLVEFCLSLPANQKMRQGLTRMIMRRGLQGILPPEIEQRGDKGNLSAAFEFGLRSHESDLASQISSSQSEAIANYVNLDTFQAAYQRYIAQENSAVDTMTIWKTINLALWFKVSKIKQSKV